MTGEVPSLQAQFVVPVHDPARKLGRAVDSVLSCPEAGVVVVLHNVRRDAFDLPDDPRVLVVELNEKPGHPGAAFNAGLARVTAPWAGIMGSDDWFEDGSVRAMLDLARRDRADGVIVPLRHPGSKRNSVKPVTWRRSGLRAASDRLFSRTAPLGLFRSSVLCSPRYRFAEHVKAGVDQLSGVRLWTDGWRISHHPLDPAYVVGDDALERVTLAPRSVSCQGAMWREVWHDSGVLELEDRDRRELGAKIIRVHVFDWIKRHPEPEDWFDGDFEWLASTIQLILRRAPGCLRSFSRAERNVVESLVSGDQTQTVAGVASLPPVHARWPQDLRGLAEPASGPRLAIALLASSLRERAALTLSMFGSHSLRAKTRR